MSGAPIKFVGTGETMDALEPFYPERMANRILGMGDMLTLYEKAQEAFKVRLRLRGGVGGGPAGRGLRRGRAVCGGRRRGQGWGNRRQWRRARLRQAGAPSAPPLGTLSLRRTHSATKLTTCCLPPSRSHSQEEDVAKFQERMAAAKFDFNDFIEQFEKLNNMGGMKMLKLMPGFSQVRGRVSG